MKTPHKRAQKTDGNLGGSEYSKGARGTIAQATGAGMNQASTGPTKTVAGNPHTGMGVTSGKSVAIASHGGPAGISAGRSRTRRGTNNTGSGPQGLRG